MRIPRRGDSFIFSSFHFVPIASYATYHVLSQRKKEDTLMAFGAGIAGCGTGVGAGIAIVVVIILLLIAMGIVF